MADVAAALRPDPAKFADKAVKSVRGRVTNISEHLPRPMTVLEFRDCLLDNVMTATPDAERYAFSDDDRAAIERLRDTKYATWQWNYGHSPRYNFSKRARTRSDPAELAAALDGAPHRQDALRRRLAPFAVGDYFVNVTADDLLSILL